MIQVISLAGVSNAQVAEWLVDLADDLRDTDLDEIKATAWEDPAVVLVSSVMLSEKAWVILDDNEDPIAVFGVASGEAPAHGLAWMLGSPKMDTGSNATGILRQTRDYVAQMHEGFPILGNWVDARNLKSLAWLRWAGFIIDGEDDNYGVEGRRFLHFTRRASV